MRTLRGALVTSRPVLIEFEDMGDGIVAVDDEGKLYKAYTTKFTIVAGAKKTDIYSQWPLRHGDLGPGQRMEHDRKILENAGIAINTVVYDGDWSGQEGEKVFG